MMRAVCLLLNFVLTAWSSDAVNAQTVRGKLIQYPDGSPLPGATLLLLDTAGVPVDSTRSGGQGAFTLRARRAGSYALHFSYPGYASVPSEWLRLAAAQTVDYTFSVPLISGTALRRMSETIVLEKRLQSDLPELCGEPLRPESAGIIVGVVRSRADQKPLAGAIVRVEAGGSGGARFRRATVTSANGVYVMCNVPVGTVTARTELAGFQVDEGPIQVRAGEVGWYDVRLKRR